MDQNIRGYILTGGKSTRMGRDKSSLVLARRSLAQRAYERLALVCSEVSFCGAAPPELTAPELADGIPGAGPLAGIVSSLNDAAQHGSDTLALVLAVDLPLVPWELLYWLAQRAQLNRSGATIPFVAERPQPLCAVYRAGLAPALSQAFGYGERKIMRAVEAACNSSAPFDLFDLAAVMPPHRRDSLPLWFTNVNSPQDLTVAEQALQTPRVW